MTIVTDFTSTITLTQTSLLVATWALYGTIHSALASLAAKRTLAALWPATRRYYRLAFNTLALLLLAPPLWLTFTWRGPLLWQWHGPLAWIADALAIAAMAGFVWTTRHYDMGTFSGLTQWQANQGEPDGHAQLHISPLHRYVRHPWYFLGLVVLWTREMDSAQLVSSLCITIYLWGGSRLEERKLLARHGDVYARYRQRVCGLFPIPWRILGRAEARDLENCADHAGSAAFPKQGGRV